MISSDDHPDILALRATHQTLIILMNTTFAERFWLLMMVTVSIVPVGRRIVVNYLDDLFQGSIKRKKESLQDVPV